MLMRVFLTVLLAIIPAFVDAQAITPIAQIQALLEKPQILCGNFNQTKLLMGIHKPLLSNGRFCVESHKGILWQTVKPFPNTLRLSPNEIIQMQGKQTMMQMDAAHEPVVRMINSVLFSLLAGDFSQLDKIFMLNSVMNHDHWHVALKAREPGLAKVIGNISLEGGKHVEKVIIQESNGDLTTIVFSHIQNGRNALSKNEEILLDQS